MTGYYTYKIHQLDILPSQKANLEMLPLQNINMANIFIIMLNWFKYCNEVDKMILQNNNLPNVADDKTNKIMNISFEYNFLGIKDSITYSHYTIIIFLEWHLYQFYRLLLRWRQAYNSWMNIIFFESKDKLIVIIVIVTANAHSRMIS